MDDLSVRYGSTLEELRSLNPGVQSVEAGDVVKVLTRPPDSCEPKAGQQFVLGFYAGPMGAKLSPVQKEASS
ncbi:hypothetical protein [Tumebacillus flagellatus]|uniref:hypothetical protein n=1 Tax=Tumebacillus flagellatus TaxID=1157490 RepID=UPI001376E669